jgi:hypothetical protein
MWLNKKHEEYSVEIGTQITKKEFETTPIDNPLMMETQISSKTNDHHCGGQVESRM